MHFHDSHNTKLLNALLDGEKHTIRELEEIVYEDDEYPRYQIPRRRNDLLEQGYIIESTILKWNPKKKEYEKRKHSPNRSDRSHWYQLLMKRRRYGRVGKDS